MTSPNRWQQLSERGKDRLLAFVLACLGMAVRLPNLGWGLPDIDEEALPMKKALEMWGWDDGRLSLDPQTAGWPSLSFYVHLLVQKSQYAVGRVFGRYDDDFDYLVEHALDAGPLLILSRLVGVVAVGLLIYATMRAATRVAGRWGAALTAMLLVVSPMLIRHAQLVTPDILLTLFAALAIVKILDLHESGGTRDYVWAGIFIGLGIASKYTPILLAPSLYAAHLLRLRAEGRALRGLGLTDRRLGFAALACVLTFVATSPFLLTDLEILRRDFSYQALHMSKGHFGQESTAPGYLYYIVDVLVPGLGLGGFVLAAASLFLAAWRLRGPWLVLVLCVLPFYLGLGSLSTRFERYMLPMLMPLSMGLAALVPLSHRYLASWPRIRRGALLALLTALALVPAAWSSYLYHQKKAHPSTQHIARDYILERIEGRDPALVMEAYSPRLVSDRRDAMLEAAFFQRMSPEQRRLLTQRETMRVDHIPMNAARVELSAFYYDLRHYLPYDYIVTSGAVRGRYLAAPETFPDQTSFYEDLDRYAERETTVEPTGHTQGPEIRIYSFSDEAKARLIEERGALTDGFYKEYIDRLHAPHFHGFVQSVARRAGENEQWEIAALYYDALLETLGRDSRRTSAFVVLMERSAYVNLMAGSLERAATRSRQYLELDPASARVAAYLGQALEGLGRQEEAIAAYERCLSSDRPGSEEWAAWAREQLSRLAGEISPE